MLEHCCGRMLDRLLGSKWKLLLTLIMLSLASAPASSYPMFVQTLGPADLGHVDASSPLDYAHEFDVANATIMSAALAIVAVDQPGCLIPAPGASCDLVDLVSVPESADIDVAGADFASGPASFALYVGDVTDALVAGAGILDVRVSSDAGDFYAMYSLLLVSYEPTLGPVTRGGGGPSVPEPTAATLFGLGALLIARASRRTG